jgi:hypothetical protein
MWDVQIAMGMTMKRLFQQREKCLQAPAGNAMNGKLPILQKADMLPQRPMQWSTPAFYHSPLQFSRKDAWDAILLVLGLLMGALVRVTSAIQVMNFPRAWPVNLKPAKYATLAQIIPR